MAGFATLDDVKVKDRRVLVRADLNVPMKDGRVTDATRIERLAPTIRELADKGAKVGVLSHFGRPSGKPDKTMSLAPRTEPLGTALGGRRVGLAARCIAAAGQRDVAGL